MPYRELVFAEQEIYHLLNRSVAQQPIFRSMRDYQRLLALMEFYRYANPPLRYSHFNRLPPIRKEKLLQQLEKSKCLVEIIAFCLMPNHLHLLVRQQQEKGTPVFMANLQNSYARYFNTKYKRSGALFQAMFKAIRMENDEQFLHVSRYIHLNPVSSYLVEIDQLSSYPWSSFPGYLGKRSLKFVNSAAVIEHFASRKGYEKFVHDQADYQRDLENIKHLTLEE